MASVELLRARVDAALDSLAIPVEPAGLYDAVRYALAGGGKRVRPILALLAAETFGGDDARERAMPAALAIEVFHNFTLVHDDIMDSAVERRGSPTTHVRWDEPTAILAGDFLMGLSYDLLAQVETDRTAEIVRLFHRMVARLCEGQALDMMFERQSVVSVADYLDMIERKTAALLEAALELGALVAGAADVHREALRVAGRSLGRAFQIQDDLLDLTADDASWGKRIGGDLVEGKKTYLLLRSLEIAEGDNRVWFQRIVQEKGLETAHIDETRRRMESLGVLREARGAVDRNYHVAISALEGLPPGAALASLRQLISVLSSRSR